MKVKVWKTVTQNFTLSDMETPNWAKINTRTALLVGLSHFSVNIVSVLRTENNLTDAMITQIYSGCFQTHVQLTFYIQVLVTAKKLKVHTASHLCPYFDIVSNLLLFILNFLKGWDSCSLSWKAFPDSAHTHIHIPYPGHVFFFNHLTQSYCASPSFHGYFPFNIMTQWLSAV